MRLFAEAATLAPEVALRRFVENALGPDPPAELVDELFRRRLANPPDPAGWQAQAAAGTTFQGVDGEITAPTLILTGTADNVVDQRNADVLAERIPGARVERFPGRRAPLLLGAARRVRQDRLGVPAMNQLTIDRIIRDRARITPERVAIDEGDRTWTYAELDARSDELARGLRHGDRVSTLTGNSGEHVALMFACAKAGAILHPISWRLAPAEVAYQLDDAEPAVFLIEDEHRELGEAALELASVRPARRSGVPTRQEPATPDADDPLLLIYTSGTTGKPKGALLTHANCFWTNLSFDLATGDPAGRRRPAGAAAVPLRRLERAVDPRLVEGATIVLERGFDAARALDLIERERVTTMMGVPANYLFMSQEPRFASADLSTLRLAVVGGAPMPEALLDAWAERGVEIVQGYGLTEAAPNVLCLAPEDATRKAGYAGKPYPYVTCDLSDEGELLVRGPNVFPGYWRNDGGDRGRLPRRLAADRRRRRARRRGQLPHSRPPQGHGRLRRREHLSGGDRGGAARASGRRRRRGRRRSRRAVGRGLRRVRRRRRRRSPMTSCASTAVDRLARFKVPKSFHVVDELPRNSMGKIQKSELR